MKMSCWLGDSAGVRVYKQQICGEAHRDDGRAALHGVDPALWRRPAGREGFR